MDDTEPTEWAIDLRAQPDAAGVARRFVDAHAATLPAEVVADAELLVSELVTNAVLHGRPVITLRISVQPPLVGISVRDEGEQLPSWSTADPSVVAPGGRGLVIVDRLSTTWGVTPTDPPPGKTVWFRLDARQ